ncbi:MAG TPA: triose-phosphate isomerase [Saprospiraceae bacterium]|nr:triose-phosphate isomerase [Saprospiraceae bacterium]
MRKFIVAGNWKMNTTPKSGKQLVKDVLKKTKPENVKVIFGPPFTHLLQTQKQLKGHKGFFAAAQNMHQEDRGAYTGEISVEMLEDIGAKFVIIGHSERRLYFKETNALLLAKTKKAILHNRKVIFCCGEPLAVREKGTHFQYVMRQLSATIFKLSPEEFKQVIIAYEPIWAIGTGRTASPEQAQDMHFAIRAAIKKKMNEDLASGTSILYGGSVKPSNALEIFKQPDVDGGLVGGASLHADDFVAIIEAAKKTDRGR